MLEVSVSHRAYHSTAKHSNNTTPSAATWFLCLQVDLQLPFPSRYNSSFQTLELEVPHAAIATGAWGEESSSCSLMLLHEYASVPVWKSMSESRQVP